MTNDGIRLNMFNQDEFDAVHSVCSKIHDELAQLSPFDCLLAQATFQTIQLPKMIDKVYEQMEANNLILSEIRDEILLLSRAIRRKAESPALDLLPDHNSN